MSDENKPLSSEDENRIKNVLNSKDHPTIENSILELINRKIQHLEKQLEELQGKQIMAQSIVKEKSQQIERLSLLNIKLVKILIDVCPYKVLKSVRKDTEIHDLLKQIEEGHKSKNLGNG